jgi:hypothetical protein
MKNSLLESSYWDGSNECKIAFLALMDDEIILSK